MHFNEKSINIPSYIDQKDGLVYVNTYENFIHQSYLLSGGQVIVFEVIPVNYPASTMAVYNTLDEYIESIRDVNWINDKDFIAHGPSELLEEKGYPFSEAI